MNAADMTKKQNSESGGALKWILVSLAGICLFFLLAGIGFYYFFLAPALQHARGKAERITCQNNLKIVGLGFRTWAVDHDQKFPFEVSQSAGGTLESCQRDASGVDANVLIHFLVVSNELMSAKYVLCPTVTKPPGGHTWANLKPETLYHLHTARAGETIPNAVLAYCPVHHFALSCNGEVKDVSDSEGNLETKALAATSEADPGKPTP